MDLGQFTQAEAMGTIPQQSFMIDVEPWPADMLTFKLGSPHASPDALHYQVAFQFSDGADDDDDGAAQWTAGVDVFPEADELDAEVIQFIQHFQEVADRTGQSVEGPDHDYVETAMVGIFHQLIKPGPPGPGTRDLIDVFFEDSETTLLNQLNEVIALSFGMLVQAADS
jgi:hypothetical protein